MNIFNNPARVTQDAPPPMDSNPQTTPVTVELTAEQSGSLKIDRVVRIGSWVLVAGWRTAPVALASRNAEGEVADTLFLTSRQDVATHMGLLSADGLGFVLVGPAGQGDVEVLCGTDDHQVAYAITTEPRGPLDANACALMMPALEWLASTVAPFSPEWIELVAMIPVSAAPAGQIRGVLDQAVASANVRCGLASGWITAPSSALAWLQDSNGGVHGLADAFGTHRDDVRSALSQTLSTPVQHKPGFCAPLAGIDPGAKLYLRVLHGNVIQQVAEIVVTSLSMDPVEASRSLFATTGISTARMAERMSAVEGPILDALIAGHRAQWPELPVRVQSVGQQVSDPKVSIIVPLFGRADFVEHQLIEFERDDWLRRNAELIYVIDDRTLIERFTADAHAMHRLYGVPFRWIWGGINRGFAGANNLGADHAIAPVLLFMNSDVFPQAPGWLPPLLAALEQRSDIGVVGPRLVFADGSIQHAGMEFQRREELGIWINHHPLMGLDPALDPRTGLCEVPAITGACMVIRRTDFDRAGGWDTGYLIGDFEDSDLCLKLRREGLKSAYLPEVQLTHLERQSFRLLGQGDFRSRVTLYNALRHQRRWHDLLVSNSGADVGARA